MIYFQVFLCFAPLIILVVFSVWFSRLQSMCKSKDMRKDYSRNKFFNRIGVVYLITWLMLYACAWIVIVELWGKV